MSILTLKVTFRRNINYIRVRDVQRLKYIGFKSLILSQNTLWIFKRNPFVRLCSSDGCQKKRQNRFLGYSHYKFVELTLSISLSNFCISDSLSPRQAALVCWWYYCYKNIWQFQTCMWIIHYYVYHAFEHNF